jgi:hypothetical protein
LAYQSTLIGVELPRRGNITIDRIAVVPTMTAT